MFNLLQNLVQFSARFTRKLLKSELQFLVSEGDRRLRLRTNRQRLLHDAELSLQSGVVRAKQKVVFFLLRKCLLGLLQLDLLVLERGFGQVQVSNELAVFANLRM